MNIVSSPLHSLMLGNFNVEDDDGNVVDGDDEKDEPVCPLQSQWPQWYFAGLTSYFSKVSLPLTPSS